MEACENGNDYLGLDSTKKALATYLVCFHNKPDKAGIRLQTAVAIAWGPKQNVSHKGAARHTWRGFLWLNHTKRICIAKEGKLQIRGWRYLIYRQKNCFLTSYIKKSESVCCIQRHLLTSTVHTSFFAVNITKRDFLVDRIIRLKR